MCFPIGGNTKCTWGTSRAPSRLATCLRPSSAAASVSGVPGGAGTLAAMRAERKPTTMLRSALAAIGVSAFSFARSAKARRAMVACGCLVSLRPSAHSIRSGSRLARISSMLTSQAMRWAHVPWSMWHGKAPLAYSSANRELPPRPPKAEAFCTPSKRAALSRPGGAEEGRPDAAAAAAWGGGRRVEEPKATVPEGLAGAAAPLEGLAGATAAAAATGRRVRAVDAAGAARSGALPAPPPPEEQEATLPWLADRTSRRGRGALVGGGV